MKKILCIGHSHMNAVMTFGASHADVDFMSCLEVVDGVVKDRDVRGFADVDAGSYQAVFLFIRGSRHIMLGMVNRPDGPFDFYLPEQPDLPRIPEARLYPHGLLKQILARHMRHDLAEIKALHAIFRQVPVYVVESPAPSPQDHVARHPAGFAEQIAQLGISPASLRYKFWRMHSAVLRDLCDRLGMRWLPAPPESVDEAGMLRLALCRDDPTHGNSAYGKLVLQQLRALAQTPAEATA